jgi:hypothetical protein
VWEGGIIQSSDEPLALKQHFVIHDEEETVKEGVDTSTTNTPPTPWMEVEGKSGRALGSATTTTTRGGGGGGEGASEEETAADSDTKTMRMMSKGGVKKNIQLKIDYSFC